MTRSSSQTVIGEETSRAPALMLTLQQCLVFDFFIHGLHLLYLYACSVAIEGPTFYFIMGPRTYNQGTKLKTHGQVACSIVLDPQLRLLVRAGGPAGCPAACTTPLRNDASAVCVIGRGGTSATEGRSQSDSSLISTAVRDLICCISC